MKSLKLFSTFTLILLLNLTNISQTPEKTHEEVNPCNQETALQLVANQVIEANKKTDDEKLIKTMIRSAEFTWDLDEQKSREYYKSGFDRAKKKYAEDEADSKAGKKEKRSFFKPRIDYRFEVIRSIAKRDGKWARKLTDEVLREFEKGVEDRNEFDKNKEVNEILRIATESLKTNRELSNYLFQRAMAYPLDYHWHYTLQNVAGVDQNISDSLYRQLLVNFRNESPRRLLLLSAYPFDRETIMGVDKFQYGGEIMRNFTINRSLQVDFANTFFNRINQLAEDPNIINQSDGSYRLVEPAYMVSGLQDLEVYIQELPQLIPRFQIAVSKANVLLNAENRKKLDDREQIYKQVTLTFEERIKELEDLDSEGKLTDGKIVMLVLNLENEEQFTIAETWLDKIEDKKAKVETTNVFFHKRSLESLKNEKFEDAKKYADKIIELEFRAFLYFKIVTAQNENYNDSADVRDRLIEVSELARKTPVSIGKAQVLLGLASMYEEIEHFAALNEISEAVKVINKLENPDIFTASIGRQISTKNLRHFAIYPTPGYNLENAFSTISKDDFNLTMAHAQSLNDTYFQTLAVLAIAKNCVENSKKSNAKKTALE